MVLGVMHKFKQGSTFALPITALDNKLPFDIGQHVIECRLNDALGNLIENLTVIKAQQSNQFLLKSSSTADWPVGCAVLDIKISLNGHITKSESFTFQIMRSETP